MPTITDVGVGGILALLILKEVFTFLKYRKNGNSHDDDFLRIQFALTEIKANGDRIRESNHRIVEKMQEIAFRISDRRIS